MARPKVKTEVLNLRLEPQIMEALNGEAKHRGMTRSELARGILLNWMRPGSVQLLRNIKP